MTRSAWLRLSIVGVVVGLVACGDDPAPGTITVSAHAVTGGQGKLLITEARIGGRQAAISCIPIAADPFDATVILETIVGPTPCETSSPIVLDAGTYDIKSVVMMGGAAAPDTCAVGQVEVAGNVAIDLPAFTAAGCQ